ncbi:MAG TPA: hypothetical protein VMD91_04145 [Candidatus Sulfotelmatobacter sp.]|nr:hypothetical protein [Candidatus Sulfotelmatobacter sp.]
MSADGATAIPASGRGTVTVSAHVSRADGTPLALGDAVRATIASGDARFTAGGASDDLVAGPGGAVAIVLAPGTRAGPLVVQLTAGDASGDLDLTLTTVQRRPLVVGYATGGVGAVPGSIETPDNGPNGLDTRRGAISIYGTGEVSRNTTLTFAYDSADVLSQTLVAGPFLDNPDDRPFAIYGDSSLRYDDALSTNRVYARLDSGRSSAMWGEFYAQAAPATAVGGYDMLVEGANVHAQGNVVGGGGFTARNDVAYDRRVVAPTGLAIADELLHPDIVVGSDVLTLVHLDRHSGAVVSQTQLVRGSDYEIDYASGLLTFTNIILPYDDAFDPQIVTVQYEYGGPGARSTMLGGNGSIKLGRTGGFESWYLNDADGSGNLTLLGESIGTTAGATVWSVSHERSNGFLPISQLQYGTSGDAYRASVHTKDGPLTLAVDYADTAAGYDNPFGNYTAPGLVSLSASATLTTSRITDLELSYRGATNQLPATSTSQAVNNSDRAAEAKVRVHPSRRFSYHLGVTSAAASSNGVLDPSELLAGAATPNSPATAAGPSSLLQPLPALVDYQAGSGHSLDADYGFDWQFAPRASLLVSRLSPLGGASFDPYDPPQTQAELDLDVGRAGKVYVRQLWQATPTESLAATQAVQTYAAGASSSTSLGFEQQVGAQTYQSGYAVDHTIDGTDLYDAIGVRSRILAGSHLTGDAFLQLGQELYSSYGPALADSSPYFMTGGLALDYSESSFHATGKFEARTGYDSGSTLELGATGPISPAVSLFGAYTAAFTEAVDDREARIGLSYRPSRNDRYVTLVDVDTQQGNLTNYDAYVTNVAQVQELYRSSTRTEWAASLAYKIDGDAYFAPRTSIYGVRGDQRIGSRFDLASEVHWSDTAPLSGTKATGLVVEGGYRLGDSLRVAAGYNFSGFADPATSVNPTHRGAYVTLSSYVDNLFGWGKGDRP